MQELVPVVEENGMRERESGPAPATPGGVNHGEPAVQEFYQDVVAVYPMGQHLLELCVQGVAFGDLSSQSLQEEMRALRGFPGFLKLEARHFRSRN